MGYHYEGLIKNFTPDDSLYEKHFLCSGELRINEMLEDALEHFSKYWPQVSIDDLTIESEKIHTRCVTYDLYCASDWDDYIIVCYKPEV